MIRATKPGTIEVKKDVDQQENKKDQPLIQEEQKNEIAKLDVIEKKNVVAPVTVDKIDKENGRNKTQPELQSLNEKNNMLAKLDQNEKKLNDKMTNDLPKPNANHPSFNITGGEDKNDGAGNTAINSPKNIDKPAVTSGITKPLDIQSDGNDGVIAASNSTTVDNDPINEPSGNKNKLRGFFRKLTRTFEKNTNIKATDDEDRLLVGSLAIKL